MGIKYPEQFKNFTLYVDGTHYPGQINKFKPPEIKVKTEDSRPGGSIADIKSNMGIEALESSFTTTHFCKELNNLVGKINGSDTEIKLRGSLNDDQSTSTKPVTITMKGTVTGGATGDIEAGSKIETDYEINDIKYYKLEVDGSTSQEFDRDNVKYSIDGENQYESMASDIGL